MRSNLVKRAGLLSALSILVACVHASPAVGHGLGDECGGGRSNWSYPEIADGVNQWVKLDHPCCDRSHTPQSPIDLVQPVGGTANVMLAVSNYKIQRQGDCQNFSFGISAATTGRPGPSITVDNRTWDLVEIHFHAPSEHRITVSGDSTPAATDMEMHVKSRLRNNDHIYGVFTVLFEAAKDDLDQAQGNCPAPDKLLEPILEAIAEPDSNPVPFRLDCALAPFGYVGSRFYRYNGSLTTPSCSPGVTFFVQAVPQKISASQPKTFSDALKNQFGWSNNARMPQARSTPPWELTIVRPTPSSP